MSVIGRLWMSGATEHAGDWEIDTNKITTKKSPSDDPTSRGKPVRPADLGHFPVCAT